MTSVCSRAKQLGDHATLYNYSSSALVKPPVKISNMNVDILRDMLTQHDMPMRRDNESINEYVDAFANGLYTFSKESYRVAENQSENLTLERWNRLLNDTDDSCVWRAIDWKGEYKETNINRVCPINNQFQSFFDLYNPPDIYDAGGEAVATPVTIPILDDAILVTEAEACIKRLKQDKAGGPDGLCPGIFKVLPPHWILSITILFNTIFFVR